MPTLRAKVPRTANAEAISKDLDMEDEIRETATIRIASYQQRMANLYNKHVKPHAFQAGDIVLRKVFENTAEPMAEKFHPNWDGSYVIIRVRPAESYALNKLDGAPMPRMWNVMHLKRYYQ